MGGTVRHKASETVASLGQRSQGGEKSAENHSRKPSEWGERERGRLGRVGSYLAHVEVGRQRV